MWSFVRDALSTRRYGDRLYVVEQTDNDCLFAVQAINQKLIHSDEQHEESWAVFLDYGRYKNGNKFVMPETKEGFTELRSRFLNGLLRCACSGTIRKMHKTECENRNLKDPKNYRYFLYTGSDSPTLNMNEDEPMNVNDVQYEIQVIHEDNNQLAAPPNNIPNEQGLKPGELCLCVVSNNLDFQLVRKLGPESFQNPTPSINQEETFPIVQSPISQDEDSINSVSSSFYLNINEEETGVMELDQIKSRNVYQELEDLDSELKPLMCSSLYGEPEGNNSLYAFPDEMAAYLYENPLDEMEMESNFLPLMDTAMEDFQNLDFLRSINPPPSIECKSNKLINSLVTLILNS